MKQDLHQRALEYHSKGRPGKIEVVTTKDVSTQDALSLAYSPGVAAPCKEIAKDPDKVYDYTTRGNLVAVITNGTAVLGLGNIGPLAGKPVMEGKGVLFKQFANIDVFDLELDTKSVEDFVQAVKALEPTFGGINLEDIKAPECFLIEERLKKEMKIPVFHDDQWGTAIITCAAFLNACQLTKRNIETTRITFNGAGAASIACARLLMRMGVPRKNILLCDSTGVVYTGRTEGMNPYKAEFATTTEKRSLADALDGADVFIGLSVGGCVTAAMLERMNDRPIVFAMANPDPEILPPEAKRVRPDVIVATGRTDYPNQVNNVLGFPSIFRGALDVRATTINEDMMIAAVKALAELAQEEVPEKVSSAYNNKKFHFGPDYIIPKPFDPRVIMRVAPAVAKAAMDSGVALKPIEDFQAYTESLEALQGFRQGFMRSVINRVKAKCAQKNWDLPRIVFPEGKSKKVLQAVHTLIEENVAYPILLGSENLIRKQIAKMDLDSLSSVEIIQPSHDERFDAYVEEFYRLRQRKGVMLAEAEQMMLDTYYFAAMMVRQGHADGLVSGASANYAKCVTPILSTIGTGKSRTASGLNIMIEKDRLLLLADTTMMIDPTAEQLATVAIHAAKIARFFDMEPRIAMLSYTNFRGETANPRKMAEAVQIVRRKFPHIKIDGEMQADTAVNPAIPARIFPFCELREGANILIFPNLDSGNIAYKLLQQLGGGEVIGPFLMGINRPAHIVQRTGTSEDVLNTAIITALQAVAYREMIRVTV